MNIIQSSAELQTIIEGAISQSGGNITVTDPAKLSSELIDRLVYSATFTTDSTLQKELRTLIYQTARAVSVHPASIHDLYMAIGNGKVSGFTVPAINVRMMTYDTAREIFKLMKKHAIGALIFEIARSEMKYTSQKPAEYTTSVLAAAIKEGYTGPVFLQGDHFQFSPAGYAENPEEETQRLKDLIRESIEAGFYNIDIDASTLVDLEKESLDEQQAHNYKRSAELTRFIREIEPADVTISVGGEIGHIGGVNSTPADFEAFMDGYGKLLEGTDITGMSKVSVQTGTSHGGIPLKGGGVAEVKLDFNVLKDIGAVAREKYHIGGPVQHGASTLPNDLFYNFPNYNTLEIHLATGFQNIVFDNMPESLKSQMIDWVKENTKSEWKDSLSEDQNIYKTRKKAIGPFKKQLWDLPEEEKSAIREALSKQFAFLFEQLKVAGTAEITKEHAIFEKKGSVTMKVSEKSEGKVDDLSD